MSDEIIDTSLIPPYDDYAFQDIYIEELPKKYDMNSFFVGELNFDLEFEKKNYNGPVYRINVDNIISYKTILSCFYKLIGDNYICLFNGKIYDKSQINNIGQLKDFIPIYSVGIENRITLEEVIKIFNMIFLSTKKFKFESNKYDINKFFYGNLRLKIFSTHGNGVCLFNTPNHILLKKFNAVNCGVQKEFKDDFTNFYIVYKSIFYSNSDEYYKAYCISDNQVYNNVYNFGTSSSNEKVCYDLILLKNLIKKLNIKCNSDYVDLRKVLKYQKNIYRNKNKL